jgi:hypothetical protein
MPTPSLEGRSILIVEDEPLIVLDMTNTLACTQAQITSTNTLKHALLLVEHDGLAGPSSTMRWEMVTVPLYVRVSLSEASPT